MSWPSSDIGINGYHIPDTFGVNGHDSSLDEQTKTCGGHGKLDAHDNASDLVDEGIYEPIAVIGMAMRLPHGIRDAESFWHFLLNKEHGRCRVPKNRFNIDAWYGPGKQGHTGTQYGYFLEDVDLANIDTSFWSISKHEAELVDPQQRLLLEVVYECLENAGVKDWHGQNIGCWVGTFGEDWVDMNFQDYQSSHMYRLTGYGDYNLSNRVSYEFDFKGPSMTIRTACSSALIGLNEACEAIHKGDCSAAIVGGTNIMMSPRMTVAMTEQGVISPTGSCKSFDADADGYARGEAVGSLYIKKLSDAIRDGDPVRAVIKATCTNSDGKTPGLTVPSTAAHEALMRRTNYLAGINDFSRTAMIECHGTGTKIGDPIEVQAVANVYGEHGIYIGSVKPNLGHSEGASGLSSVIKMILALEHRTIPPNIRFKKGNPNIPWEAAKLRVPVDATPWPEDRYERVGVNCFGIGGANAHVVLESAAMHGVAKSSPKQPENRPHLVVFSAKHPSSLQRSVENYSSYLNSHPDALSDVAFTLNCHRQNLTHRAYCVSSKSDALELSRSYKPAEAPQVVFTFTGQGAQWASMGKELLEKEPSFANSIRKLDSFLQSLPEPPTWTLEGEILKSKSGSRLSQAEFSQPCCSAIQIGIVDLLRHWNVKPHAVVGHSSGEIAAAYACESLTAKEAIFVAYTRGLATIGLGAIHRGGMAAIGLGRDKASSYLSPGVVIGCENSPSSVTLSGDSEALEQVMTNIRKDHADVLVRALHVECAYHSHHMKTIEKKYATLLGKAVHAKDPAIPFYSSVFGGLMKNDEILGKSYWVQNLISPVLFSPAVNSIIQTIAGSKVFLEIGPHSTLAGPIRQILRQESENMNYIPTLIRNEDGLTNLLKTAGELWVQNVDVDLKAVNPEGRFLTDVPTYSWHYDGAYWHESRLSREYRLRKFPSHDILGYRVSESTETDPSWRNMLHIDNVPWLPDHEVANDIVFPAAGYIAMVGEAIRQLTGACDYTVRSVIFASALVLNQGKAAELNTHLSKVRLTTSLDSEWYEFSISSLTGDIWSKHCFGQVRGGTENKITAPTITPYERKVPSKTWYRALKHVGLNYGGQFRGLSEISASVTKQQATARLRDKQDPSETPYQLHPSTLDSAFQLFSVAIFQGIARLFKGLSVPTSIDELYIAAPKGDIDIQASGHATSKGGLCGELVGVSGDEVVINLRGMNMSALGDNDEGINQDPHAAIELDWKSDINFLDVTELMKPAVDITQWHLLSEKLALACMIESNLQLAGVEAKQPYLEKLRAWLDSQAQKAIKGEYPDVPDCLSLSSLNSQQRCELIESLYNQLLGTKAAVPAIAIYRVFQNLKSIFNGSSDPLDVLLEDEVLTKVYDFMQLWEYSEFFELLGRSKPLMKILEIGAGTGGTTSTILPHLQSAYGERLYSTYIYTDISAGFFVAASQRFKNVPGMEYAVLDITKDPLEQGFSAESFDLIVACNVLHATPSLKETLGNVRKLLAPRGRLLLQELNPTTKYVNYVMGVLPGWWLGADDGRPIEPYVSPQRWDLELRSTGFGGVEAVKYDGYFNNNIIARPALEPTSNRLTVLCQDSEAPKISDLLDLLRRRNLELDICTVHDTPKAGQTILAVLDIQGPFLHAATEQDFCDLRDFVARIDDSAILWLTGAAQIGCQDPNFALSLGMARTIRTEMKLDFATLELESFDLHSFDIVPDVLFQIENRVRGPETDPVLEYVYHDGRIKVGLFHWISVNKSLLQPEQEGYPKKLEIGQPGFLQTLSWNQLEPQKLGSDEVEIETEAVGLNFKVSSVQLDPKSKVNKSKDVLMAMGIVDLYGRGLGLEASGIVRKIGPDVKHLEPGDRVLCCSDGTFSTTYRAKGLVCAKMPDDLGFTEAATMPLAYAAAIYGLIDVGRLSKGQSVLIHSACGGVGLAAIQVAKMIGAEIYCTVGSEEKVDYLMKNFSIPRNRIFNSRDSTFLPNIMRETSNRGVDVALNSLSGELLHATWKCVAEFGTMVEIGKRDFIGLAKLSMNLFEQNRNFAGVDISRIWTERPHIIYDLLHRAVEFYAQGHIKSLSPVEQFDIAQVEESMRYMQKGTHIGKIVVNFPTNSSQVQTSFQRRNLTLRSDAAYLFIGGLGGIGRSVSSWLVQNGARHIIFFSRSAGKIGREDPFIQELEAQGCTVQTISGSISDAADVEKAATSATKPIAGVLQGSMVLDDAAFDKMTFEQWQTAVLPKVQGTWNVHNVCLQHKQPLDFFFLFSSVCGLVGQWGQANYAAGNAFLDAFVQYRHSLGLPASVLDIGAMDDVGYLSQNPNILDSLRATALHILHEQDLLDSIQLMLDRSLPSRPANDGKSPLAARFVNPSQVAIGARSALPLSAPNNRTIWRKDARMAIYRNLETHDPAAGAAGASNEGLKQFLRDVGANYQLLDAPESLELLSQEIGATLFDFLMRSKEEMDLAAPLAEVGIDSLVSIELRNWLRQIVGVDLTVLEIVKAENVQSLGKIAAVRLREKFKARVGE